MNVAILICTYGSDEWQLRAIEHALPSANAQGPILAPVTFHRPQATLAGVRNQAAVYAIERGDPEWLLFLDADDSLADGYLAAMEATNASVSDDRPRLLVPAVQYVEDSRCVGTPAIPAWDRSLIDLNCACIGTLIPRQLFLDVGGFREWPIYEDFDLWLRCVRAGAVLVPVPDAIYCATRRPGSRNNGPLVEETYRAIRAEHEPHFDWANQGGYKR